MRTVKHKIKPFNISENSEQEIQFLALARAYQFEKNYWSDQLLNLLNRSHESINIDFSYNQIRDNLVKNKYQSKYNLPARIWKMALKEAYDLHIRTYESQISFIKRDINNKIYKFKPASPSPSLLPKLELDKDESSESSDSRSANSALHIFKEFLYFATNSLFYNYKTFRKFEEEFYSKNFRKARIYQRIQPILQKLLKKAIEKEVFKLNHADEINIYKENIEILKRFLHDKSKTRDLVNEEKRELQLYLEELLNHYCNCLVKAIVQFRNCKPIQSQINPTITLDGDCYDLYSKYDNEAKKNRWFLNIMSLENGRRIKGLELTGFNHAKKIMKHKKSPNLTLSFDRTDMTYYAHFTFKQKVKSSRTIVKTKNSISFTEGEANKTLQQNNNNITANMLMTMLTVGGDFGLTENYTFSDGWVSGREQGQILKHIADKTKNSVAGLQRISENGFFGLEKNNPIGKRNHKNNCFNHNKLLDNINKNYRKKQRKYNRFLQNYKYVLVNEIIEHFTSDSIYGQYTQATHESHAPVKLVFESLDYVSLGRNKSQKRQINLIKGILNVLEDKIKAKSYNLPIEIIYVNPAYTSQTCPNCCFVAKTNRDSKAGKFRCQHCGFTAIDDERYKALTDCKAIFREHLPSEDDFVAACNIAARHSAIPDSMKLRVRDIKYRLMQKHESIKVSCKIFNSS
jgi:transposase, IS605 orfB family, central region